MNKQLTNIKVFMNKNIKNFLMNREDYKENQMNIKIYNQLHKKDYRNLTEKITIFKMNTNKKFYKFK